MIDFSQSEIRIEGPLLTGNARRILNANTARVVRQLATEGENLVREGITTKHGTGFTARLLEVYQDPKYENSLVAKVRLKPGQLRVPGSPRYPAKYRPYITAAVLERARVGGREEYRVRITERGARSRKRWVSGKRSKARKPLWMFRNAYRVLKAKAATIRTDLARGLN